MILRHLFGLSAFRGGVPVRPLPNPAVEGHVMLEPEDGHLPGPLYFDWQPMWDLLSPMGWAWADIRLVEAILGASCLRAFAHREFQLALPH